MTNIDSIEGICQYQGCGKVFTSKRRWAKKYCSDSCRTLASRYRRNGFSGSKITNPRSKGVNDLYELNSQQQFVTMELLKAILQRTANADAKANSIESKLKPDNTPFEDLKTKMDKSETSRDHEFKRIHNRLDDIQNQLTVIIDALIDILEKQGNQDWLVFFSSMLGPKVGDWLEKNLINGGQSKDDAIIKALEDLKKTIKTDKKKLP